MDPMTLIMLGMIGLLIVFMVRNGKKRREMMANLQDNIQPGAEVMLQSGIFGTIESVDEEDLTKVVVRSGTTTFVVHRSAIGNVITPVEVEETEQEKQIAPDDDPNFLGTEGEEPNSQDKQGIWLFFRFLGINRKH